MKSKQIIRASDLEKNPRDGYVYQRFVKHDNKTPFNFLYIDVAGCHKTRRVLHGIRNYYVVSGSGVFVVEGEQFQVGKQTLITIQPGEEYSYEGEMELIEFNIATEGGIEHKDIE